MLGEVAVQVVGWVGALLVVAAYILVSSKKVDGGSRLYQALNLFGAIGVGVNALQQRAFPSLFIQVVWGAIAIVALLRLATSRGARSEGLTSGSSHVGYWSASTFRR